MKAWKKGAIVGGLLCLVLISMCVQKPAPTHPSQTTITGEQAIEIANGTDEIQKYLELFPDAKIMVDRDLKLCPMDFSPEDCSWLVLYCSTSPCGWTTQELTEEAWGDKALVRLSPTGKVLESKCYACLFEKIEVTIATDKTEYEQGEEVRVDVGADQIIYTDSVISGWGPWQLKKYENNSWKWMSTECWCSIGCDQNETECGYRLACSVVSSGDCHQVNATEITTWTWNQEICVDRTINCTSQLTNETEPWMCTEYQASGPGRYKLKFTYATSCPVKYRFGLNATVQSVETEFTIKGDSNGTNEIEDVGFCNSYEIRPMSYDIYEKCVCPEGYDKIRGLGEAICLEHHEDSMEPCNKATDCTEPEICVAGSVNGPFKCMRQIFGCYSYYENKEIKSRCVG